MDNTELNDIVNFLKQTACFIDIEQSVVEEASKKVSIVYFRDNESLDSEQLNKYFWIVRSGAVKILKENDELVSQMSEGDFFGFRDSTKHVLSDKAVMMEDSLLYKIPMEGYLELCKISSQFNLICKDTFDYNIHHTMNSRTDSLALTHKLYDLIKKKSICCEHDIAIHEAAKLMTKHKISSLPVMRDGELIGIITDRDLRSRVIAKCYDYKEAISTVMTEKPITIDINSFTFEASMVMSHHNVHHLPVLDKNELAGVVTVTDLIRQQRSQPVFVIGEIWKAKNKKNLVSICSNLPQIFVKLVNADARANEISRILTAISDAVTQRLLSIFEKENGKAPVDFAWLAFGSQGREELSINSDQDNALLLDDSYKSAKHEKYFNNLANFVCDGLADCGYFYCPGKIMAKTKQWRKPLSKWKKQFTNWIYEPEEKAVMFSSIFFDIRSVSGDRGLFRELQHFLLEHSGKNRIFLAHMTKNALTHRPPLGLFRGLVVENGGEHKNELDLKHKGTIPVTDIARQHALANGISTINTLERLQSLGNGGHINKHDIASLIDAYEFLADLRFRHQAKEIQKGKKPDNFISPQNLSSLQKHYLKSAFKLIQANQSALTREYLGGTN